VRRLFFALLLVSCGKSSTSTSTSTSTATATSTTATPYRLFDTGESAFDAVLEDKPLVLAIGETHAQRDATVPSTTKRFTDSLLPKLKGRATDLVLELWVANGSCGKQEKQVAQQQKDVTAMQADTNQNEFIALGDAAKKLGVAPHVLIPACDEYARILDEGTGDVDAMLSMIARLTARDLSAWLGKHPDGDQMIVAYGGAMHNDLHPRKGREAWSYGPEISAKAKGRYVELDLFTPEYIKDTDAWRSQPWYETWKSESSAKKFDARAVLFTTGRGAYALVFPRSS
jgi:hypothetical protein